MIPICQWKAVLGSPRKIDGLGTAGGFGAHPDGCNADANHFVRAIEAD